MRPSSPTPGAVTQKNRKRILKRWTLGTVRLVKSATCTDPEEAGSGGRAPGLEWGSCSMGTVSQSGKTESSGDDGGEGRTQCVCLLPLNCALKIVRTVNVT